MAKIPRISESEWRGMKNIWGKPPQTASEVIALLTEEEWHPKTIKTLLSRLHRKGVVGVNKQKTLYLYRATVSEADCVKKESSSFLDRIFGGAVKPLLVHFVENEKLSPREVEELKEILKKKKK